MKKRINKSYWEKRFDSSAPSWVNTIEEEVKEKVIDLIDHKLKFIQAQIDMIECDYNTRYPASKVDLALWGGEQFVLQDLRQDILDLDKL